MTRNKRRQHASASYFLGSVTKPASMSVNASEKHWTRERKGEYARTRVKETLSKRLRLRPDRERQRGSQGMEDIDKTNCYELVLFEWVYSKALTGLTELGRESRRLDDGGDDDDDDLNLSQQPSLCSSDFWPPADHEGVGRWYSTQNLVSVQYFLCATYIVCFLIYTYTHARSYRDISHGAITTWI